MSASMARTVTTRGSGSLSPMTSTLRVRQAQVAGEVEDRLRRLDLLDEERDGAVLAMPSAQRLVERVEHPGDVLALDDDVLALAGEQFEQVLVVDGEFVLE